MTFNKENFIAKLNFVEALAQQYRSIEEPTRAPEKITFDENSKIVTFYVYRNKIDFTFDEAALLMTIGIAEAMSNPLEIVDRLGKFLK